MGIKCIVRVTQKIIAFDLYKTISTWWQNESLAAKAAFFSALIVGFFSHLFVYAGRYFGDHDLGSISRAGAMHGLGRWLNTVVTNVNYGYILPLVSGIQVTLFLAGAAFFTIKLLGIENKINAVLAGTLLVTIPSISNTNLYLYDSANYHLAVLLSVMAVYVAQKYRHGFWAGAVLLMCVLAIYQAMFNVAVALCLFMLILQVIDKDFQWKQLWGSVARFSLMGGLGGVFYALSLVINARFFGRGLSGYRGLDFDSMEGRLFSPRGIIDAIQKTYQGYFNAFFGGRQYMVTRSLLFAYILLGVLALFLLVIIIVRQQIYKHPARMLFAGFLIVLVPLASNFASSFDTGGTRIQMIYAFVFIFVFFLILVERAGNIYPLIKSTVLCCVIFIVANWIIINNVYYLQAWFFNQTTTSMTTRIAARIEPYLPEADSGRVAVFGGIPSEFLGEVTNEFTEHGSWRGSPLNRQMGSYFIQMQPDDAWRNRAFVRNLRNLHGLDVRTLPQNNIWETIRGKVLAANMPAWPMEGSVAVIDDVIVINFGIYDFSYEYDEDGITFIAHHYRSEDDGGYTYEYHWQIWRNGTKIIDEISASHRMPIEAMAAYGNFAADVKIINTTTGYQQSMFMIRATTAGGADADTAAILPAYLARIQDENHLVIISAKDEASNTLTDSMQDALHALGLTESLQGKYRHSYAAIIDGHDVLFEDISLAEINHSQTVGGTDVMVISAGHEAGNISSIIIDGMEYSQNSRGLNIVVYDKISGAVVDTVAFDTYE